LTAHEVDAQRWACVVARSEKDETALGFVEDLGRHAWRNAVELAEEERSRFDAEAALRDCCGDVTVCWSENRAGHRQRRNEGPTDADAVLRRGDRYPREGRETIRRCGVTELTEGVDGASGASLRVAREFVTERVDDAAEGLDLGEKGEVNVSGEAGRVEGGERRGEVADRVCDRDPELRLVFPHRNSEHQATDIHFGSGGMV
jgi:hypothetical protein